MNSPVIASENFHNDDKVVLFLGLGIVFCYNVTRKLKVIPFLFPFKVQF